MPGAPPEQQLLVYVVLAAVAVIILIDLGLLIAWATRRSAVLAGRARPIFAPVWSLVDPWIVGQIGIIALQIGAFLFALALISILTAIIQGPGAINGGSLMNPASAQMQAALMFTLIVQNGFLVAATVYFIRFRYRESLQSLGIKLLPNRRDLVTGIIGGFALFLFSTVIEIGIHTLLMVTLGPGITHRLEEVTRNLTVNSLMKGRVGPGLFIVLLFGGAIVAPIGEEFFFRGFLYNSVKWRFGVIAATLISAAAFAVLHIGPLAVLGIFVMGVVLAVSYQRTQSLWVTILMHAVNNSIAIILGVLKIGA